MENPSVSFGLNPGDWHLGRTRLCLDLVNLVCVASTTLSYSWLFLNTAEDLSQGGRGSPLALPWHKIPLSHSLSYMYPEQGHCVQIRGSVVAWNRTRLPCGRTFPLVWEAACLLNWEVQTSLRHNSWRPLPGSHRWDVCAKICGCMLTYSKSVYLVNATPNNSLNWQKENAVSLWGRAFHLVHGLP